MKRFALLISALTLPAPALADTLIDNVNGIQVGADGKIHRFTMLLFDERTGRIIRTYGDPDGRVEPINILHTERIDGKGRTLLPGLIDAHGHVMPLGFGALQLDLTGTNSLADLQQRLRAYAAANPDARWIVGRGWNQELWAEKRFPTAADLDAVVSDRPVWLGRVDGHAAVANSAAMKAAGVAAATQSPAGGRIENGLFVDAAMNLVEAKIPPPTPAQREQALAKAQELMLAVGLTGAADMGTSAEDWKVMQRAAESGKLQTRIMAYSAGLEAMPGKPTAWLAGDRLRMGGVKLYADGALGSRGAWLKQPYADKPETRGLQFLTDAQMRDQAGRAAAAGFQLAIHAIGDAGNAQVISTYEALGKTYSGDRRWRIEHVQVVAPFDIQRIAKAGIIASMQPTHQTSDDNMAGARLGEARLKGAYAWKTIAATGAHLAFGSDFPVESPNPFPGLAAAISRQDPQGQPPGGWRPEERVTLDQALAGFTREAAYAGFAEDRLGSLDPGKWADFIIVDRDISASSPTDLAATQVLETWVAGKKVWRRPASAPAERGK